MSYNNNNLSSQEQDDIAAAETKIRSGTSRRTEIRGQVKNCHIPALKARNALLVSYCELVSGTPLSYGDLYIKMEDNMWHATAVYDKSQSNEVREIHVTVDPLTYDLIAATKLTTSQYADPKVSGHTSKIKIKKEASPCIHDN